MHGKILKTQLPALTARFIYNKFGSEILQLILLLEVLDNTYPWVGTSNTIVLISSEILLFDNHIASITMDIACKNIPPVYYIIIYIITFTI